MSKPNQRVKRTHVDVTLETLVPVEGKNENNKSYIYYCPFCIEKVGKKDTVGKLYLYKSTLTGVCFRCNTYITIEADLNSDFDFSGLDLRRLSTQICVKTGILPIDEPVNISTLQPWYTNADIISYLLTKRGPHIIKAADSCQFKAFVSKNRTGIYIPYFMDDVCVTYQIRYTTGYNGHRYWTRPGKRFLYTPGGLYVRPTREITLCEGIFDSIALDYLGYSVPIAINGSALSSLQLNTVKELAPEIVNIAMDDLNLSRDLLKKLKKELDIVEKFNIITFDNKDPDDYVKDQINYEIYRQKARSFAESSTLQEATL